MEGILLIDKPVGYTSHDIVAIVRKKLKIKRVGHAGTLDPLATGLLIILVGKTTKKFDLFMGKDKAYRSTLILGKATDTGDIEGKILKERDYQKVTSNDIQEVFRSFVGELAQLPPMFSAVKYKGKKLYELARAGITVERETRPIRIDCLNIEREELPNIQFYLECSKGTYVRQLAMDIGEKLGCGACISKIQRVKIGEFDLSEAINIEAINESHIRDFQRQKVV